MNTNTPQPQKSEGKIVPLPDPQETYPPNSLPSDRWWMRWWMTHDFGTRSAFGRLLCKLLIPGAVRETRIYDELTDQSLKITVDMYNTVITVNGRDFIFCRYTGRYQGRGMGCRWPH